MSNVPVKSTKNIKVLDQGDKLRSEMQLMRDKQDKFTSVSRIYRANEAPAWMQPEAPVSVGSDKSSAPVDPVVVEKKKFTAQVVKPKFTAQVVKQEMVPSGSGNFLPIGRNIKEEENASQISKREESNTVDIVDFSNFVNSSDSENSSEEELLTRRRDLLKMRQLLRTDDEKSVNSTEDVGEQDKYFQQQDTEAVEQEVASEDEEFVPIFVKRSDRIILEKQQSEEDALAQEEYLLQVQIIERQKIAKELVTTSLEKEAERIRLANAVGEYLPDDKDDPEMEVEELEKWTEREMRRVYRMYTERLHAIEEDERRDTEKQKQGRLHDLDNTIRRKQYNRDHKANDGVFTAFVADDQELLGRRAVASAYDRNTQKVQSLKK